MGALATEQKARRAADRQVAGGVARVQREDPRREADLRSDQAALEAHPLRRRLHLGARVLQDRARASSCRKSIPISSRMVSEASWIASSSSAETAGTGAKGELGCGLHAWGGGAFALAAGLPAPAPASSSGPLAASTLASPGGRVQERPTEARAPMAVDDCQSDKAALPEGDMLWSALDERAAPRHRAALRLRCGNRGHVAAMPTGVFPATMRYTETRQADASARSAWGEPVRRSGRWPTTNSTSTALSDDELVEQMHDDLYDGLKEEIEEGVQHPARRAAGRPTTC